MQHALLVAGRQSFRPRLPPLTSLAFARYASKSAGNSKRQRGKQAKDEVEAQPKGFKQKGVQTLDQLVPGSQQVLSGDALAEYKKTAEKMDTTIQFYRKEVSSLESLAVGRVTPDVLKPVRVSLPDSDPDAPPLKLHEIATVGVRDGTNLIVTVFDESSLKHVEKAIYSAKIPHVAPQRLDARTIKIPMPKPTVEAKTNAFKTASGQAEEMRVQLRKLEQAAMKKGKYAKFTPEFEEFHELLQKKIKEVDDVLASMKKSLGVK